VTGRFRNPWGLGRRGSVMRCRDPPRRGHVPVRRSRLRNIDAVWQSLPMRLCGTQCGRTGAIWPRQQPHHLA
jgi:hypothetical protein